MCILVERRPAQRPIGNSPSQRSKSLPSEKLESRNRPLVNFILIITLTDLHTCIFPCMAENVQQKDFQVCTQPRIIVMSYCCFPPVTEGNPKTAWRLGRKVPDDNSTQDLLVRTDLHPGWIIQHFQKSGIHRVTGKLSQPEFCVGSAPLANKTSWA